MEQNQKGSKAYLISIVMVAVLGGLLFGYDTAVISGAEKGLQAFFKGANDFEYSDFMHGFTSSSALIGCIIGSSLSGLFASNLGRKRSLIFAGICFFLSAWGSMEPESYILPQGQADWTLLVVFNFYRVLGGIGVGMASAICPMYIGEIAPSNVRGMLVSWNQFAIIFGQLVVYFVNFLIMGSHANPIYDAAGAIANMVDAQWTIETGWRYMFGSEMVPAGLFTFLICFVPETPRYLVMVGQDDKAFGILSKINGSEKAREIIHDIKNTVTVKTEKLFLLWFHVHLRRCYAFCIPAGCRYQCGALLCSSYLPGYGYGQSYGSDGYHGCSQHIVHTCGSLHCRELGRKPLLIFGSIGMAVGALGVALTFGNAALSTVTMISIMVYSASFMFSWGPIAWVLIAELFPNTIRGAAVAIAVAFQWIFNFIVSSTFVPMFNMHLTPGDDFGHWFTHGLYGAICILAAIFVWKLVPETKGKTLEDMSKLWRKE